jgi:hypothetical protein
MPPPVAVRHLSMSRRHRAEKRRRGREKNSIKLYMCVYMYVCVLVQVCARTHSSFEMKKYELATSNQRKKEREREERLLSRENNIYNA